MNFFARIFWLPFNNRVVDAGFLPDFAKSLESFLVARGFLRASLSDELLRDLVSEAYARARAEEPDKRARYGVLWEKMEEIAENAAQFSKGCEQKDSVVGAILSKHGAKPKAGHRCPGLG